LHYAGGGMMRRRKCSSVIVVAVALVLSCNADGPGQVADFCAEYAAAICQVATTCGASTASCQAYQQAQCTTIAAQSIDGRRRYTSQNVPNCINQLKAAYGSSAPITPATQTRIDRACQYVYQGTAGLLGGSCVSDYDCAGPTDGTVICDGYVKKCAIKKTLTGGQSWTVPGDVCATNFYFSVLGPGGVCIAGGTSAAASPCSEIAPCDGSSRCVYVVNGVYQSPGTCMPRVGPGEGCGADSDCSPAAPHCDTSVYPAVCSAGLQFGPDAPSCTCVASPCLGAGGSTGTLGGSSGGRGGAGGTGGSSGIGGSAGSGGVGSRDGGSDQSRDAASCSPLVQDGGILGCGCSSDTSPVPVCVAGAWTCPPASSPARLCARYCSFSPPPPPGCRCDPTNGALTCAKDGGPDAVH
jgi:hypothetical protein